MMEDGTDAALIVSIVSLAFAALALLWNIMNATLLDRARLDVSLEFGMKLYDGAQGHQKTIVLVEASNIGKRPVRIHSLMLAFGRPFRAWMRLIPKRWRHRLAEGAIMLPGQDPDLSALSTDIPVVLGVGETAIIYSYEQDRVLEYAQSGGYTRTYAVAGGSTASGRSRLARIPFPD